MKARSIARTISTHDLEETVFHESVHATMDIPVARDPAWLQAQIDDGGFLTEYGASLPKQEDLAETACYRNTVFRQSNLNTFRASEAQQPTKPKGR